jgi:threonine aldolase
VIAAAALFGLDEHRERLVVDHERAWALACGLARHDAFAVVPAAVETNIVIADVRHIDAAALVAAAAAEGLRFLAMGATRLRFVTHLDLADHAIEQALSIIETILPSLPSHPDHSGRADRSD